MDHECIFVAAGCSAETEVLDIGSDGAFAYGSGHNVLLRVGPHKQLKLLSDGPNGQVHAVRLINVESQKLVAAVAADGSLGCWTFNGARHSGWKAPLALKTLHFVQNRFIFAGDNNGNLYGGTFSLSDPLDLHKVASFGSKKIISLCGLKLGDVLLAVVGLSDNSLTFVQDGRVLFSLGGHSNWINSIDVKEEDDDVILLATASSDRTVRIWKVAALEPSLKGKPDLAELIPSRNEFTANGRSFRASCEAILYGHEGQVNSVRWSRDKHLERWFISASTDRTMILWRPSPLGGWQSATQLGDISGISTASGFFSAFISSDRKVIAHGAAGSIIVFAADSKDSFSIQSPLATGHISEINGCSWSPEGDYLLTVGNDRTTRIWAPKQGAEQWCEIARPQIHGYELLSIVSLDHDHFLSAADEKIIRSFRAPRSFHKRLTLLKGQLALDNLTQFPDDAIVVPALGLSNKLGQDDAHQTKEIVADLPLNQPPSDSDLSRLTLWLETDKLYGHGLELYCHAVSPDAQLAASASKATVADDAAILLWNRQSDRITWRLSPHRFKSHELTVTKLVFSPDGGHLLAVSRDRHWSLYNLVSMSLVRLCEAHSRIIWGAAWAEDSSFFLTASRDRTVKAWSRHSGWEEDVALRMSFDHPVTAIALKGNLLAVGLEDGTLSIYSEWKALWSRKCHSSPIKDLKWSRDFKLASVSDTLQLYDFYLNK